MNLSAQDDLLCRRLQQIWGYSEFRYPQREVIEAILNQQDALIILPTGGGKSLCFQLPALMQAGLTIVISPLVALMENQIQDLRQRKLSAAMLHSEMASQQRKQVLWMLEHQKLRLLYLSPETLFSQPVWQRLCEPSLKINTLIVDESHCLAQWGETFRPAYFRLGTARSSLLQHKPPGSRIAIAAFTATANPTTQAAIEQILQLEAPQIFRINPYRANLRLSIQSVSTPRQRRQRLIEVIKSHSNQSGLVYVRSRREAESLTEWLRSQGYKTAAYHAGLKSTERRTIEQSWIRDQLLFVVCTCAFGMGINKPATRWIVHFHAPFLLSEYVQEIGRAGRDGKPAIAVLLKSAWFDFEDRSRWNFFEEQERSRFVNAQKLMRKLPKQGNINEISKRFDQATIALSLLHQAKQLNWRDPFHYEMTSTNKLPQESLTNSTRSMRNYLKVKDCRWRYLLRSFGFEQDAIEFFCGTCDYCLR